MLNSRCVNINHFMKTFNNLFPQVYSYENLYHAYKQAAANKRARETVLQFAEKLEDNLRELQIELINKTYQPGKYKEFYVYDPKTRLIKAAPFRDRIVHHALCNVIEPIFDKRFIDTSYACRINKGVDKGVDKVSAYIKEMYRKYGAKSYVLKCDVSKYFQSIDKSILRGLIFKKIRCRETRWLVDKVLNSTEGKTGIPVGNLTSQLFANIYLHELDVFVKEKLHVKRYARYMDDFVILSDDKQYLHRLWKIIESFLSRWLHLKLNPKTAIFPITQGVDFLGYRIFAHRKLLRKQYVKRSKRMIKRFVKDYKSGQISYERVEAVLSSWRARVVRADVPWLRADMAMRIWLAFGINTFSDG